MRRREFLAAALGSGAAARLAAATPYRKDTFTYKRWGTWLFRSTPTARRMRAVLRSSFGSTAVR